MSDNPILDLEVELFAAHARLAERRARDLARPRASTDHANQASTTARAPIRRRRRWSAIPLIAGALVVCGAAAAAVVLTGHKSLPPSGPLPRGFDVGTLASNRYKIELTPDLATGQIAWCTTLELLDNTKATTFGSGGCSGRNGPLAAPSVAAGQRNRIFLFDLLTANVAAVRVSGSPRLLLPVTNRALPRGWKVAVTTGPLVLPPTITFHGQHAAVTNPSQSQQLPTLTPLDASLKPLPINTGPHTISLAVRVVSPLDPPANPCSIRVLPLPGLTAVRETVLRDTPPTRIQTGERGYLSCASVELTYDHQPVIAALLLDAEHPGRRPTPLPDTHPLAGSPGTFVGPGAEEVGFMRFGFDETAVLTARRHGDAWLVLQGPKSRQQREAILRVLRPHG